MKEINIIIVERGYVMKKVSISLVCIIIMMIMIILTPVQAFAQKVIMDMKAGLQ